MVGILKIKEFRKDKRFLNSHYLKIEWSGNKIGKGKGSRQ